MLTGRKCVWLDVHARSVASAAIDGLTGELFRPRRERPAALRLEEPFRRCGPSELVVITFVTAAPVPAARPISAG